MGWVRVSRGIRAFTLLELLATTAVILILAAVMIGIAGYVQRKAAAQRVRTDIYALENALELYKLDFNAYPTSSVVRVSKYGLAETENSTALYRALAGGSKKYIKFRPNQLQLTPTTINIFWRTGAQTETNTNVNLPLTTAGITNYFILDPWGKPLNYYNTRPVQTTVTPTNVPTGFNVNAVVGGQVNQSSFDLMSYGPDMATYEASVGGPFANSAAAKDDITNFRR